MGNKVHSDIGWTVKVGDDDDDEEEEKEKNMTEKTSVYAVLMFNVISHICS